MVVIEPLGSDAASVLQCLVIDATSFPYPSADFGRRAGTARVLVARVEPGAPVIGFVAGRIHGPSLHLEGLAVAARARRRGAGRALVRAAVATARAERMGMVTLHVGERNTAAIALYRSEGFAVEARLVRFYSARAFGTERDAYEMALRL